MLLSTGYRARTRALPLAIAVALVFTFLSTIQNDSRSLSTPHTALVAKSKHLLTNNSGVHGVHARAFTPWPKDYPLPCISPASDVGIFFGASGAPIRPQDSSSHWSSPDVLKSPTRDGLLFLKPFKTGSSTTSGVHIRIARNLAQRQNKSFEICKSRFGHGPTRTPAAILFPNRLKALSFLWTVIREPTKRVTSEFFHFQVSRRKVTPTDDNFKRFLTKVKPENNRDYYLRSLYTSGKYKRATHDPVQVANEILSGYDFIGITERLDESLVALMMLLSLKMGDVLYLSAKRGGYDAGGRNRTCTYIVPSFVTAGMQAYFDSSDWHERVKHDLMLYQAANRSLDLTIEQIGRTEFVATLQRFQEARQLVQSRCAQTAIFPCDDIGIFQNSSTDCLWKDSGCGTLCIDQVATELNLW